MKTKFSKTIVAGFVLASFLGFVGCSGDSSAASDDEENVDNGSSETADNNVDETADYNVDEFNDLPNCSSENEGATGYVANEKNLFVCQDGVWIEKLRFISSSSDENSAELQPCDAPMANQFMVYDGSTYKCYDGFWNPVRDPAEDTEIQVICLKTEDPNAPLYCYLDTAIWSSSSYVPDEGDLVYQKPTKITGGSITGVAQKGPYLQGSTYRIMPLDGETLQFIGDTLTESFNNSQGTYVFCDLEMPSQYAMLEANGYYRSELTGNKSNLQMTIGAIVDVQKGANINMLTNLEYERVKYLVQNEGYNIAGAKKRALIEVLSAFHIEGVNENEYGEKLSAEQLDITAAGDANGALLAVSIMIQSATESTEFDVKDVMSDFREDIKEDGAWTGKTARTKIADIVFVADSAGNFPTYRHNVEGWELSDDVPMFERYINDFWGSEFGIGKCTEERFGEIKKNQNAASLHKENYFLCDTVWYRLDNYYGTSGFVDSDRYGAKKLYRWRDIGEFERNTRNQKCDVAGLVIPGNIDKDKYYICEKQTYKEGWREATGIEVDKYYTECTRDGKLNLFSDGKYYKCSNDEFIVANSLDSSLNKGCVSYIDGKTESFKNAVYTYTCIDGSWRVNDEWNAENCTKDGKVFEALYGNSTLTRWYVCDAGMLRVATEIESIVGGCVSSMEGKSTSYNGTNMICNSGVWYINDSRDGQIYKTTAIGSMVWMAENLNVEVSGSMCYNNDPANCEKYGRLYTWEAAKTACPDGWHLPSVEEFGTFLEAVFVRVDQIVTQKKLNAEPLKKGEADFYNHLRDTSWEGGFDTFGFSALPAGLYYSDYKEFYRLGYGADFWSSTELEEYNEDGAYGLSIDDDGGARVYGDYKSDGLSVRCLKDN